MMPEWLRKIVIFCFVTVEWTSVILNNALIIPHSDDINAIDSPPHHYLSSSLFVPLQFYDMLVNDAAAKAALDFRSVTVFAPTNQAYQRYPDTRGNVLYHMSK